MDADRQARTTPIVLVDNLLFSPQSLFIQQAVSVPVPNTIGIGYFAPLA